MLNKWNVEQPIPRNHKDFEVICALLFQHELAEYTSRLNWPDWRPQSGVDIYGRSKDDGGYVGVQCKKKSLNAKYSELSFAEIKNEALLARSFKPQLSLYIVITTGYVSDQVRQKAHELSDESEESGYFPIVIMNWTELVNRIASHDGLYERIFPFQKSSIPLWAWLTASSLSLSALVGFYLLSQSHPAIMTTREAILTIRAAREGTTPPESLLH